MVHFIGKDITYFHTLFWPAMLHGASLRTPSAVYVHGFLTVDGAKMSKSRGTFINARTWLDHLHPDYFRYYLAAMLGPTLADVDLDLKTFEERVNSHLVGKWVNIASRCAGFLHKHFDSRLADSSTAEHQQRYDERRRQSRPLRRAVRSTRLCRSHARHHERGRRHQRVDRRMRALEDRQGREPARGTAPDHLAGDQPVPPHLDLAEACTARHRGARRGIPCKPVAALQRCRRTADRAHAGNISAAAYTHRPEED